MQYRYKYAYVFAACVLIVLTIITGAQVALAVQFTYCQRSPATLYNGDYATISWSTRGGATSCTMNNVGEVGPSGQITVGPFPYANGANDFSINCYSPYTEPAWCPIGIGISCGNNFVDPGEECDLGANNGNSCPSTCSTTCRTISCSNPQIPVVTASFSPNPVQVGTNSTLTWNGNNNSGDWCTIYDESSGASQQVGSAVQPIQGSITTGPHNILGINNWVIRCSSPWASGYAYPTITVSRGNEAQCMSVSGIPSTVQAGVPFTATVVMKNTGINAWTTDATPHRLGSQSSQDNTNWGLNRVALPSSPINPGSTATFTFTATPALTLSGPQTFAWRMVEDGVEWFPAPNPSDPSTKDRECSVENVYVDPPPAPVVTLSGKSAWDLTPITAPGNVSLSYGYGSASDTNLALTWTATNDATACRLKKSDGTLVASFGAPPGSYNSIPALYANQGYYVECDGPGGTGTSGTITFVIPPVPTNLSATPNNAAGTQERLTWTNPDNSLCAHGNCSLTYVRIYKASYSNTNPDWAAACSPEKTAPEGLCSNTTPTSPYLFTTTPNTDYRWYIHATDDRGAWSNAVPGPNFITAANIPVVTIDTASSAWDTQTAITNGVTKDLNISYGYTGTINWSATNSPTSCAIYNADTDPPSSPPVNAPIAGNLPASGSWPTPSLYANQGYYVRCTNAGGAGNSGIAMYKVPPQPTLGKPAHECSADGSSMTLYWKMPSGYDQYAYLRGQNVQTGYVPLYNDLYPTTAYAGTTTYTWTGLTPGEPYTWWVHSRPGASNSAWSLQTGEGVQAGTANIVCNGSPDLTVPDATGPSVSPVSPSAGQTATFTANLKNIGTATGANFPSAFRVANPALTVGHAWVPASPYQNTLAAQGQTAVTGTFSTSTPGTYKVRLCANFDTTGNYGISESNQGNNCGPWTDVTVGVASLPDFTVGAVSPSFVTVGSANTMSASVTNGGTANTSTTFPNIFQFANDASGAGAQTPVAGSSIVGLNAAQSKTTTYSWTPATAGTYYLRACADNSTSWVGSVQETNEGNNCSGSFGSITACVGGCDAGPPNPRCVNGASNPPNCNAYPPTATLSANPTTVNADTGTSVLTWQCTNATTCSGGAGFNTGDALSGNVTVGPWSTAGDKTYRITAEGPGGSAFQDRTITVIAPRADIWAEPARVLAPPNNTTLIKWTSTNTTSCTVKKVLPLPETTISTALSNPTGQSVTINAQTTYRIDCATEGSPVTNSVIVNTTINPTEF